MFLDFILVGLCGIRIFDLRSPRGHLGRLLHPLLRGNHLLLLLGVTALLGDGNRRGPHGVALLRLRLPLGFLFLFGGSFRTRGGGYQWMALLLHHVGEYLLMEGVRVVVRMGKPRSRESLHGLLLL